jgi:DNA helicase-2/ATP-dependent DNA helicase PcrA
MDVVLESTGVCWRPVFNILEEAARQTLVNPQHLKTVPGRKTDVKDAEWVADLLRHGPPAPSFRTTRCNALTISGPESLVGDVRRRSNIENFRSTGHLVALSNAIAAPLNARPDSRTANADGLLARLHAAADEPAEAGFVAAEIGRLLHSGQIAHAGQVAVLVRTNAQTDALALALRAAKIPYHVRADSALLERSEVRDVVAYLRLAHSPADGPALARIVDTPPRRLRSIEQALRRAPVPTAELPDWAQRRGGPPARQRVEELLELVEDLHRQTQGRAPAEALDLVVERTGYRNWAAAGAGGEARLASLETFARLLAGSGAPDLGTWLADLHLGAVDTRAADQAGAVTVSTIHRSKGLEWPVVFLVGTEDGLLPLAAATGHEAASDEEERRLAYVAVSRPQVLLYVTYCRTRRPIHDGEPGSPERRRPSRYLYALPPAVVERIA